MERAEPTRARRGGSAGARGAKAAGAAGADRVAADRVAVGAPVDVDPALFPGLDERRRLGGPARERWEALVLAGGPILADGAMGTMLFQAGLQFGDPPEVWNLVRPDVVRGVHRAYLAAGSRILLTNTFGGNRLRMKLHGRGSMVDEINRAAALLLRAEVDAAATGAFVAGDIGPSGEIVEPLGTLPYDEAVDVFAEQATALAGAGVDLIWIETMSDLHEMRAAIQGVRRVAPGVPLIATMTFDTRGRTMMGVTPEQAVTALSAWGADAVGGNCGNGPDELVPVIEKMHAAAPDVLLVAKSNAGIPGLVDMRAVYTTDPQTMATEGLAMRRAGAAIVGACCGSTPDHVRAIGEVLTGLG